MPSPANGLQRDLGLIRRRAWLFIPFVLLGVLVAFMGSRVAGDANAVASMQLETVVNDAVLGGDRGLRIFEAQSMTSDEEFKALVRDAVGDPDLDYARYNISLNPISVADGVARGVLTVSITDGNKGEAERLRDAWIEVFLTEYTTQDGLFRTRFLRSKEEVAAMAEERYINALAELRELPELASLPIDEIVRPVGLTDSLIGQLNIEDARLRSELAEVLAAISVGGSDIQAAIALETDVPAGQGLQALRDREAVLRAAINDVESRRVSVSDSGFSPEALRLVDTARSLWTLRNDSYTRLNNAYVTSIASQSTAEVTLTSSGGLGGTLIGQIAVVLAVTLIFGLIAIYLLEWLSQVRSGSAGRQS
jgi:hypothetical protein